MRTRSRVFWGSGFSMRRLRVQHCWSCGSSCSARLVSSTGPTFPSPAGTGATSSGSTIFIWVGCSAPSCLGMRLSRWWAGGWHSVSGRDTCWQPACCGGACFRGAHQAVHPRPYPHCDSILIRFALGAGEAVIYPASNQFVAQWIPVAERGTRQWLDLCRSGRGPGLSISDPHLDHQSLWVACFVLVQRVVGMGRGRFGTPSLAICRKSIRWSHARSWRSFRQRDLAGNAPSALALVARGDLQPQRRGPTLSYFSFGYVAWIFFSWFFIYLAQVRHLNLKSNAFFSMIPFIAMTVCCLGGGMVSDALSQRFGLRRGRCSVAAVAFALTAIFLVVGSQVRGPYAASVILAGRCGRALPRAEFVLGGERQHCRGTVWSGVRGDEHGLPDWGSGHRIPDSLAGRTIWLELGVRLRGGPCRRGRSAVAVG